MKIDLRKRQSELERDGKFDVDMNEVHRTFDAQPTGGDFEYLPKRPSEKFRRLWLLSIVSAVGPIINFFASGVKVRGKKNLRALKGKGAVSVCNHVLTLDTLILKNALGPFRLFNTGSYYLMKKGWLGKIFKAGGFLPVGFREGGLYQVHSDALHLQRRGDLVRPPARNRGLLPRECRCIARVVHESVGLETAQDLLRCPGIPAREHHSLGEDVGTAVFPPGACGLQGAEDFVQGLFHCCQKSYPNETYRPHLSTWFQWRLSLTGPVMKS